jgi:hypothetical protein
LPALIGAVQAGLPFAEVEALQAGLGLPLDKLAPMLVHRQLHRWTWEFLAYRAEWDADLMQPLPPTALPPNWRSESPADELRTLGNAWVREQRSAVLAVPSVIIPEELNFLLNPAHPNFKRIRVGKPQPLAFDPRRVT